MSVLCPRCGMELGHWPMLEAIAHVNDPAAPGHDPENRHVVDTYAEVGEDLDRQTRAAEASARDGAR